MHGHVRPVFLVTNKIVVYYGEGREYLARYEGVKGIL